MALKPVTITAKTLAGTTAEALSSSAVYCKRIDLYPSAGMRLGGSDVTSSSGIVLAATTNYSLPAIDVRDGDDAVYNLAEIYVVGAGSDTVQITYWE